MLLFHPIWNTLITCQVKGKLIHVPRTYHFSASGSKRSKTLLNLYYFFPMNVRLWIWMPNPPFISVLISKPVCWGKNYVKDHNKNLLLCFLNFYWIFNGCILIIQIVCFHRKTMFSFNLMNAVLSNALPKIYIYLGTQCKHLY